VAKALAQGLGSKVKRALETTIRCSRGMPTRTLRWAAFHAEVIDKVGALLGGMTYGADAATGPEAVPGGAEAQPGLGHRHGRVRQRPGLLDAGRRGGGVPDPIKD
jgi:hypothetical protein